MDYKGNQVARFVASKINCLVNSNNESATRASLANLRRGIGKPPGCNPNIWAVTLGDMPEDLVGTGKTPSRAEWAVHIALTLFALHQQGCDINSQLMHKEGNNLGKAVGILAKKGENEIRIKRRFDKVVTATSPEEITHHLRGVVQLLRSDRIPLDYYDLAKKIYDYQIVEKQDYIRLQWGRSYLYALANKPAENNKNSEEKG